MIRRYGGPGFQGIGGLSLASMGGGCPSASNYLLYDQFTTNRTAGAVDGTLAEQGPGIRHATDPSNKIATSLGWLKLTSPGAWDTTYLYYTDDAGAGFARAAGRVLEFDVLTTQINQQMIAGFFTDATPALVETEHALYLATLSTVYVRNGNVSTDTLYDYVAGTIYRCRIVLAAVGAQFYLSGGIFGPLGRRWTLVHTDAARNGVTLWPGVMNYNAVADADNINIPITTPATNTAAIDTNLQTAITTWQADASLVHTAGVKEANWVASSTITGVDANGRTWICPGRAAEQEGYIRQIKISVAAFSGAAWKFKVFRWNKAGATYTFISDTSFTPAATGAYTLTPGAPLAVRPGDVIGLFLPTAGDSVDTGGTRAHEMQVETGDISADDTFGVDHGDATQMEVDCLTNRPYLCVAGDSIIDGKNTALLWRGSHDDYEDANFVTSPGIFAHLTSAPCNQLRTWIGAGNVLQYQDHAQGSIGYDFCRTDLVPAALAVDPERLIVAAGVNDIVAFGLGWADIEADLNAIAGLVAASNATLYVCEIMPANGASDAQAALIRTVNSNMISWCAANGAVLIRTHDQMGQIRPSTGQLDDLLALYNYDGVHLTLSGVDKLAEIIYLALVDNL